MNEKYFTKTDWDFFISYINKNFSSQQFSKGLDDFSKQSNNENTQKEIFKTTKHIDSHAHKDDGDWGVVSENLQNLITTKEATKILKDYSLFYSEADKKNVFEYILKKYSETKEVIFSSSNNDNRFFYTPSILTLYLKDKIENKEFEKLPEWLNQFTDSTLTEIVSKKSFSTRTLFKFLENINPEEVETFLTKRKNVFEKFPAYHDLKQKVSSTGEEKDIDLTAQSNNSIILKRTMNFNFNSLFHKYGLKNENARTKFFSYLHSMISSKTIATSYDDVKNKTLEVNIEIKGKFNDDFLSDNSFNPYTDMYNLRKAVNDVNEIVNSIKELMEVPEFKEFYNSQEDSGKFLLKKDTDMIHNGLILHRQRILSIEQKDAISEVINNTSNDKENNNNPHDESALPHIFKM